VGCLHRPDALAILWRIDECHYREQQRRYYGGIALPALKSRGRDDPLRLSSRESAGPVVCRSRKFHPRGFLIEDLASIVKPGVFREVNDETRSHHNRNFGSGHLGRGGERTIYGRSYSSLRSCPSLCPCISLWPFSKTAVYAGNTAFIPGSGPPPYAVTTRSYAANSAQPNEWYAAPGPNRRGNMCITHVDSLRGYGYQALCKQ
jgi:hypothetical protein